MRGPSPYDPPHGRQYSEGPAGGPHLGEKYYSERISAFPILGCAISRVLCEKWALARRTNLIPLLLRNSGVKCTSPPTRYQRIAVARSQNKQRREAKRKG